ncbi:USP20, partial [Symbiodinium necroappetens]
TLLLKSYQNYVRAWRQGLDRDRNGQLDYNEFKMAVKDVGFAGNARELWHQLDENGNGV